jgi:NAD-dependent dihydropyrimidine dehydrogenase PreA subunit
MTKKVANANVTNGFIKLGIFILLYKYNTFIFVSIKYGDIMNKRVKKVAVWSIVGLVLLGLGTWIAIPFISPMICEQQIDKKMKRTMITIDTERCIGCGACVQGCQGGALQLVDGKAVVTNEDFCVGLGVCIGICPVDAIKFEEREVEPSHKNAVTKRATPSIAQPSELTQFPVQLRLLNPRASFLQKADLLLAADCTAFANGEFHSRFLKGKKLAIACPKLDDNTQAYVDKLVQMIDESHIGSLTVLIMEVPCCSGLARIAELAIEQAKRKIPVTVIRLSTKGEVVD